MTKKKKVSEKRFSFNTYVGAVEASRKAIKAFDLKKVTFEEVKCGYDGAELQIPDTPLAVMASFEGVEPMKERTDYEFLVWQSGTGRITHCATDQLRWVLAQPDWVYFATQGLCHGIFNAFDKDGEDNWSDEIEAKREKVIKGALDFLMPWLHVAQRSPTASLEAPPSELGSAMFVMNVARNIYLSMPKMSRNDKPVIDDKISRDDLAAITTQAIRLLVKAGTKIPKGARTLETFYEDVFMKGPHKKGKTQGGFDYKKGKTQGGFDYKITHSHPITAWFWKFCLVAKLEGWLRPTLLGAGFKSSAKEAGFKSSAKEAGRSGLAAFRSAIDGLQGALTEGKDGDPIIPATFGDALNFLYDHAQIFAEHGIQLCQEHDLAGALAKLDEVPEDHEGPIARAAGAAIRALIRICPTGALNGGGDVQLEECRRMALKGYPHIRTDPRTDIGAITIHGGFKGLEVWDLPTSKERCVTIDPADICDAQGGLLPYKEALEILKTKYNDFDGSTAELDAATKAIDEIEHDAGLSFQGAVLAAFGPEGAPRFNQFERLEASDSSYTQINEKGVEVGEPPLSCEFHIDSKHYKAVFLAMSPDKTCAHAQAVDILKKASAWNVYNSYADCGKSCWLQYRGLIGKNDELRVKEWDPKKDLKPGMYQDFVDWCFEVPTVDGWQHEICRYDGKGDVHVVEVGGYSDNPVSYHAWGIWRE